MIAPKARQGKILREEERDFFEIVGALFISALIFRYMRRQLGFDVNDPAATSEERIMDLIGNINRRELREGREPFYLIRAPRSTSLTISPIVQG